MSEQIKPIFKGVPFPKRKVTLDGFVNGGQKQVHFEADAHKMVKISIGNEEVFVDRDWLLKTVILIH